LQFSFAFFATQAVQLLSAAQNIVEQVFQLLVACQLVAQIGQFGTGLLQLA
jgi:hypothetical protein